ncbi:hypothetical protein [Devosia sp. Root105]|uniref:hypothetical protein n=1 Tax=Devosia sp. Root105 TaxID=1736423 RepID=UPI0006F8DFA3|nr:hypothetical protein [Devosia sp. Root105]
MRASIDRRSAGVIDVRESFAGRQLPNCRGRETDGSPISSARQGARAPSRDSSRASTLRDLVEALELIW